jgi:hypothetical protein
MTKASRRRFLMIGAASLLAAPAIVRASSIMKVRPIEDPRIADHIVYLQTMSRLPPTYVESGGFAILDPPWAWDDAATFSR